MTIQKLLITATDQDAKRILRLLKNNAEDGILHDPFDVQTVTTESAVKCAARALLRAYDNQETSPKLLAYWADLRAALGSD